MTSKPVEENLHAAFDAIRPALDTIPNLIGTGIDIADVAWAERILTRYPKQLGKLFNPPALEYCMNKKAPAQYLAARMALKEAILKALGTGLGRGMKWLDVELVRTPPGKPDVMLHGKALERAEALGITRWELSIAHRGDYAVAIAVALGPQPSK